MWWFVLATLCSSFFEVGANVEKTYHSNTVYVQVFVRMSMYDFLCFFRLSIWTHMHYVHCASQINTNSQRKLFTLSRHRTYPKRQRYTVALSLENRRSTLARTCKLNWFYHEQTQNLHMLLMTKIRHFIGAAIFNHIISAVPCHHRWLGRSGFKRSNDSSWHFGGNVTRKSARIVGC